MALATDVYAATYFYGAFANRPNEFLDTNLAYVSQSASSCGQPNTSTPQPLVVIAGTAVNEVVHYLWTLARAAYPTWGTHTHKSPEARNRSYGLYLF